jgi:DNA mismatch endonuclease (patch repair protein)
MSRIRNADTAPELLIRRGLHMRGYRFRLHRKEIPGCPDLTLPKYRSVILVNGCFWHGHECPMFKIPETRKAFWTAKIRKNRERDAFVLSALSAMRWRAFVLWECSIKGPGRRPLDSVLNEIAAWLAGNDERGTLTGKR